MAWADLLPRWPDGGIATETIIMLITLAVLKLDRSRILYKNSSYIDRLGWSIIGWDAILGSFTVYLILTALYPSADSDWIFAPLTAVVIVAAVWQWILVRIADRDRVSRVMGSDHATDVLAGDGEERRHIHRRTEDRELRHLEPAYSIDDVHPIPEGD